MLVADGQGFQLRAVEECEYAQHLFVVLVVAHGFHIDLEEGDILRAEEVAAELIDVDGLVVLVALLVVETALGHEAGDAEVLVQTNHGAVHPRLVLRHEGEVRPRVVQQQREEPFVEDEVTLDEQGVVLHELLTCQGEGVDIVGAVVELILHILDVQVRIAVTDVATQPVGLIAHDDNHPGEGQGLQLGQHPVDEAHASDLDHALGLVAGEFAQSASHARGKDYRLHNSFGFLWFLGAKILKS